MSTVALADSLPLPPPFGNAVLEIEPEPDRMDELHLYHGSRCNRACAFCCVNGAREGHHTPFTEPILQSAVGMVARRGSLKIYGGEPTLDMENLIWTVERLRQLGFAGAITIFTNGLRPQGLMHLLNHTSRSFVVLNYAIFTGRGEAPLPPAVRKRWLSYHALHPGRVFLSHEFTVAVGREDSEQQRTDDKALPCFRCWPTLTSEGDFHACPFAVEYNHAHYRLGTCESSPERVRENFHRFLAWVDNALNPEATRRGVGACEICTGRSEAGVPDSGATALTLEYRPARSASLPSPGE